MEIIRTEQQLRQEKQDNARREIAVSVRSYAVVIAFLAIFNAITCPSYYWVVWPALGWGLGVALKVIRLKEDANR